MYCVQRSKVFGRPKKFVAIIAGDAEQASAKIIHRLKKYNANIGTVWFDSHGRIKKDTHYFYIGHDEINFKKLKDSSFPNSFNILNALFNK